MEGTAVNSDDLDVEDVEYLRHGDQPLLARIYKPRGEGPFPVVVEIHGGGWYLFERTRGKALHESLAKGGITVIALDFRQGEGAYPGSLADINYAIRWVKAHAAELKTRPDLIAISGNSSGGHLSMLVAMRPHDPRYQAIPLPTGLPAFDASLRCVVTFWPVINPLSRYRHLQHQQTGPKSSEGTATIIKYQQDYWGTEDAMAEGNPMLMLERGEKVTLLPAIWIQPRIDNSHNYRDLDSDFPGNEPERFASRYRAAGGDIELVYFDAPRLFVTEHPAIPQTLEALDQVVAFVHRHVPVL